MRYERKEQFEKVNAFGTGTANTAYAQYLSLIHISEPTRP